jgi:hypothetical protein
MNDLGEATLLLNWLNESDAMESTDYGFLLNLFLETNHMISECPNTPEGRHLANQLQKKSNTIGHKIESLEDTIDVYLTEYFEATAGDIVGAEFPYTDVDAPEYEITQKHRRTSYGRYSWNVVDMVGPAGRITSDNDWSVDFPDIEEFVHDWAEEKLEDIYENPSEHLDFWDDPDTVRSYSQEIYLPIETISYEFEETIGGVEFPIKVLIAVQLIFGSDYNESSDEGWERI